MNGNSRDILGAVLAGGRSSRMGRDKAGLLMGQDTFLARALRAVRSVCPEAVISLRPDAPCRAAAEKAGKTVWDITVWDWSRPQSWATPWCATAAGGA